MNDAHQQTFTQLLRKSNQEQPKAFDELFRQIYDELYQRAHQQRKRWSGDHTLNTTALLHEAYLKLVDQNVDDNHSRAHFYATASKAMRHILINYERHKKRSKRGGDVTKISLNKLIFESEKNMEFSGEQSDILLILENALEKLEILSPRQSKIIECRFFGGMTIEDTATALGVSPRTVKRSWKTAQLWLYREMQKELE